MVNVSTSVDVATVPRPSTDVNGSARMASMPSALPLLEPVELAACCAPVTGGVVSDETAATLARMFKALGDPTRVKLLSLIAAAAGGEAGVCDMTEPVGLSQPTVSHHMRLLVEAGLATREQR